MLVKLANNRGGHDNITVQMARVVDVGPKGNATIPGAPMSRAPSTMQMAAGVSPTMQAAQPQPVAYAQPQPAAQPIAQPPTADWNTHQGGPIDHTEMGTEIMQPFRPPNAPQGAPPDAPAMSARYGMSGPANGPMQPLQPPPAAASARLAPTANFEAFRMNNGPASLPLPPSRRPGGMPTGPQPAYGEAPFAPLAPSAGTDPTKGGIVFIIVGASTAIAILILVVLWAVVR